MTREELIDQRKDMTDIEVAKAVMLKMVERYRTMYEELRLEYREGKRQGWDKEALFDMRTDMHETMVKGFVLGELCETLDERCLCYRNGIDYD